MAGGTVAAIFLSPVLYIFSVFGGLITEIFGDNISEVILPYEPEKGIVWEYDDFKNDNFYLKEIKIDDDTQIFVFEAYTIYDLVVEYIERDVPACNKHYVHGYYELIFTDKNGNSVFYYANTDNSFFNINEKTMKIYAPGEYVKWEYTPIPEDPRFEFWYHTADDNEYNIKEVDGQTVVTFIQIPAFDEDEEFVVDFSFDGYSYHIMETKTVYEYFERYSVTFKMTDGEMTVTDKSPATYKCKTIADGDHNGDWVPVSKSEIKQ